MVVRYLTQGLGMFADPMRSGLTSYMVVVIKFEKKIITIEEKS